MLTKVNIYFSYYLLTDFLEDELPSKGPLLGDHNPFESQVSWTSCHSIPVFNLLMLCVLNLSNLACLVIQFMENSTI